MDVRAIVLVGPPADDDGSKERLAGVPLALLDVLGKPMLHRMVERLQAGGIDHVSVICCSGSGDAAQFARLAQLASVRWSFAANDEEMWRLAEQRFSDSAQEGAEVVVALRMGPYAELDFDHFVQYHLDQGARVTAATHDGSEFGIFAISSSRRNDAAFLFRHRFTECRTPCTRYALTGYFNPLAVAADLRLLARDGLFLRNAIRATGKERKPGVWVADGARIDRGARILAPAFIGARARVRAAAVLTRGASIEHHADIDCGSVIEDTNVLPFSCVGAGLDVSHAVVGFRRLYHLKHATEVEFSDPKLVGMSSVYAPVRALASAASLAAFLPTQIFHGFFGKSRREKPMDLPAAVQSPPPALQSPALHSSAENKPAEFPSSLAVVRRYGNE
jgi:NDP-sugar pyrophosphorylase family protein